MSCVTVHIRSILDAFLHVTRGLGATMFYPFLDKVPLSMPAALKITLLGHGQVQYE